MTDQAEAERMAALRAQLRRDKSDLLTEILLRNRTSGASEQSDLAGKGDTGQDP